MSNLDDYSDLDSYYIPEDETEGQESFSESIFSGVATETAELKEIAKYESPGQNKKQKWRKIVPRKSSCFCNINRTRLFLSRIIRK